MLVVQQPWSILHLYESEGGLGRKRGSEHWMEVGVVCTCLQVTIVLYGDHDSSIVLPVSWQDSAVLEGERVVVGVKIQLTLQQICSYTCAMSLIQGDMFIIPGKD